MVHVVTDFVRDQRYKPPNWETAVYSVVRTWRLVFGNVSQCSDSIPIWSCVEYEIGSHQFLSYI